MITGKRLSSQSFESVINRLNTCKIPVVLVQDCAQGLPVTLGPATPEQDCSLEDLCKLLKLDEQGTKCLNVLHGTIFEQLKKTKLPDAVEVAAREL